MIKSETAREGIFRMTALIEISKKDRGLVHAE